MTPLNTSLWIMLGGALGAWLRINAIQSMALIFPSHPYGMIIVNTLGSLVIGILYLPLSQVQFLNLKYFLLGGCLGAFTTFSTYALDIVLLWSARRTFDAFYVGIGVPVLSILAVFCGVWIARKFGFS